MAEQFLMLMADLDEISQAKMQNWYDELRKAGYTGTQTQGLPYHISLAAFALHQESEVIAEMERLTGQFAPIPVHISHIGIFSGGKVLFGAPDMSTPDLLSLHDAIQTASIDTHPWTPHATLLIDEPETVQKALGVLLTSFQPFNGRITKLHLCAFWPTREIVTMELKGLPAHRKEPSE